MQLPDGRTIKIGGERFEAAEALFNPCVVVQWVHVGVRRP